MKQTKKERRQAVAKRNREKRKQFTPLEQLIRICHDPSRGKCTREVNRLLRQIRDFAELIPGGIESVNNKLAECNIALRIEPRAESDKTPNQYRHLTKS